MYVHTAFKKKKKIKEKLWIFEDEIKFNSN